MRTARLWLGALSGVIVWCGVVACGQEPTDEAPPIALTPDPAATPAATPQEPTGPRSNAPCESFGNLTGTAVASRLDEGTQTFLLPLSNRPVTTRLGVIALTDKSLEGKAAILGAGQNLNYATCTHCMVVAIGCTPESCEHAAWFLARSGTATFEKIASKPKEPFRGHFDDVTLEQVRIDFATLVSTPVVGGACITVPSLTFDSIAQGDTGTEIGKTDGGAQSTAADAGGGGDASTSSPPTTPTDAGSTGSPGKGGGTGVGKKNASLL